MSIPREVYRYRYHSKNKDWYRCYDNEFGKNMFLGEQYLSEGVEKLFDEGIISSEDLDIINQMIKDAVVKNIKSGKNKGFSKEYSGISFIQIFCKEGNESRYLWVIDKIYKGKYPMIMLPEESKIYVQNISETHKNIIS